jgi:hypothetical protein
VAIRSEGSVRRCRSNKTMSPRTLGICHCEKRSDVAIPGRGSEDGDRHVAARLAMTVSCGAGRPPAGVNSR